MVNLTHFGAVFVFAEPVFGQTLLVERDDVFVSGDQGFALGGGQAFYGCGDLGRFDAKVTRTEFGAIELGRVVTHGFIASVLDVGEDRRHGVPDILGHSGTLAKASQIRIEGLRRKLNESHGEKGFEKNYRFILTGASRKTGQSPLLPLRQEINAAELQLTPTRSWLAAWS
jgi:hypothetical protein